MLIRLFMLLSLVLSAVVSLVIGAFESYRWLWAMPSLAVAFFVAMLACLYGYLDLMSRRVDKSAEQDGDDPKYRKLVETLVASLLPFVSLNVKSKGLEKVPNEGRFLLVCNHTCDLDPAPILYALPGRQLAFIAKKEVRDFYLIGAFLHKIQGQFINRENDREALRTIIKCIQIIKEDKGSVAVFPEGRIYDDRKFHRFRPGVFKIAYKTKVPVVVCTLKNNRDMLKNLLHCKGTDVQFSVLEVIQPEEFLDVPTTELAERCYQIMAADLGPENVAEE
jgi:1-acyl-sn-glycerol-3-phosphate acyltransferase